MRRITNSATEGKRGSDLFIFESMQDVIAICKETRFETVEQDKTDGEWLGDWATVLKRSKRVWAEGAYEIMRFVEKLKAVDLPEIKSHKRKMENSDNGDEIDLDRLRDGQSEFWKEAKREETTGPTTVTVVIDISTSWNVKSLDVLWRGAAGLALVQILEEKGYGCDIWVTTGSNLYSGEGTQVMTATCLKRCTDPLDVSTMINTVAAWSFRTLTFTFLRSICDLVGKTPDYGLGRPMPPRPADLDNLTSDKTRIYLSDFFSFDSALTIVQEEVKRIAEHQPSKI